MRAARYLASLPEVDKGRVAAIGFSMGAFRAWQVAALTDAVTAGVAVNWMATLDGLMVPGNNQLKGQSAFNMLHPGMFRWFDYPDAAAIAAPKPMLFYAGETDPLFPVASVRQAFASMERVWADAGAPDRFAAKVWPNAHIFRAEEQAEAFDWLDRQFGRAEEGRGFGLGKPPTRRRTAHPASAVTPGQARGRKPSISFIAASPTHTVMARSEATRPSSGRCRLDGHALRGSP